MLPKSEGFVMTQQFDMLEDSDLIVRSPRGKENESRRRRRWGVSR